MKKQVRRGVFETNSSSVHSITMCSQSEYDEFGNGNLYIERWGDKFYTKAEVIDNLKKETSWKTGELLYPNVDWDDEEQFNKALDESDFCTCEQYWDLVSEEYETFKDFYTSKDGETVVAFGYYGHD